jgi:hypothetical protein
MAVVEQNLGLTLRKLGNQLEARECEQRAAHILSRLNEQR